jgi:RNA polymerase sigma-70 factor (ECF subfamily)
MGGQKGRDERLVERARSGDRAAQHDIWCAHRRWVAAIILAHRPQSVEVEDLMQDVALKFVSRIETLREVGAFKPWLRRITINACRGAARGDRPMLRLVEGDRADAEKADPRRVAMPAAAEGSGEARSADSEAGRLLLAQVMTLPTEYREPLLLRCIRSMTYQQISDLLDLPVTTVETRLARARRMLRQEVGEQCDSGAARGCDSL